MKLCVKFDDGSRYEIDAEQVRQVEDDAGQIAFIAVRASGREQLIPRYRIREYWCEGELANKAPEVAGGGADELPEGPGAFQ